jgi:HSP20 family protein
MAFRLAPWRKRDQLERKHDGDPFMELQREMNRLFQEFNSGFDMAPLAGGGEAEIGTWMPRVNVSENEKEVVVSAELPGMEQKDIDVSLTRNTLTIKGEKKSETEEKDKNVFRRERVYGTFLRELELPIDVEPDKVDAEFKNGVLTVKLPKSKATQQEVKKIAVKS